MKLAQMSWKRKLVYAFLAIFVLIQGHSFYYFYGAGWRAPIFSVYYSFDILKLRFSGVENPEETPKDYLPVQGDDLVHLLTGMTVLYVERVGTPPSARISFWKFPPLAFTSSSNGSGLSHFLDGNYTFFDDAVCTTNSRSNGGFSCRRYYQNANGDYLLYRPPPLPPSKAELAGEVGRETRTGSWINLEIINNPEDSYHKWLGVD